ncbi:MAG: 2,3-bisphosphoglycerate-dependent phosphoglycerate mutase [Kiloniellaceae bacterium]
MSVLVLVRHGKTEWSSQNRFAGWADAPLSTAGEVQARAAGRALATAGYRFDLCCTSYLSRASKTLDILLSELRQANLPIHRSWRLNERHYGGLQGHSRAKMALHYGNEQVALWRRSFDAAPPGLSDGDPRLPSLDPLYAAIDPALLPRSESLQQAAARVAPWWHDFLAPRLRQGKTVLVAAHTSSIRGLVREIESLDDDASAAFRIATAVPLIYTVNEDLQVLRKQELTSGWSSRMRRFINKHKPGRRISWV